MEFGPPAGGWNFEFRPSTARAIDMSSEYYKIKDTGLSIIKDQDITKDINITGIMGENYLTQFTSFGFSIKSGLSYLKGTDPFTFSLAAMKIEFPQTKNTGPVTKSLQLIIKNGQVPGYQIFTGQLSPFTTNFTLNLPGQPPFTPPDISKENKPYTLLSSNLHNITKQTILNFSLTLPKGKEKISYQNQISIVALPKY